MKYTLDYEKYAELARRVAAEGSVLLRNEDNVLPLQKGQRVSIFGRTQFEHYKSGTGSGGMVNAPYVTNITDSLKEDGTVQVNEVLEAQYREWLKDHPFEIGGQTGIAELFELDFPETIGQDIHAIGGTQVFQ